MRQIRRGVFETNSSSTHSITICSKEEYEDWKQGKILFNTETKKFATDFILSDTEKADAIEEYKEQYDNAPFYKKWNELSVEEQEQWYKKYYISEIMDGRYELVTYEEYFNDYYLNTYCENYQSPKGEEFVAFGKYGYD